MSLVRIAVGCALHCYHIGDGYAWKYRHAEASFDTFSSANYTWEGEDFDYSGGQFIDNPQTNAYYGLSAETDVDTHQVNLIQRSLIFTAPNSMGAPGQGNGMSTEINGDVPRNQYENPNISVYSGASTNDYSMGYFSGGTNTTSSWANYTRHYPAGSYNVYGRLAAGGGVPTELLLSQITSGWEHSTRRATSSARLPCKTRVGKVITSCRCGITREIW